MNPRNEHPDENGNLRAPKRLVDELGALFRVDVHVPPEVDDRLLNIARRRIVHRRPHVRVLRWAGMAAAAAAAAVLIVVMVGAPDGRSPLVMEPYRVAGVDGQGQDLDGNGRVDILDAFKLARCIEAADQPMCNKWDMNGDGAVDRGDVDVIAMAAVSLNGGAVR